MENRTREREREREERALFDNGRNGRRRAAMPRSRADTASQSGNSVIEQRRQRAEKRAYKERQAGPVSALNGYSSPATERRESMLSGRCGSRRCKSQLGGKRPGSFRPPAHAILNLQQDAPLPRTRNATDFEQ